MGNMDTGGYCRKDVYIKVNVHKSVWRTLTIRIFKEYPA